MTIALYEIMFWIFDFSTGSHIHQQIQSRLLPNFKLKSCIYWHGLTSVRCSSRISNWNVSVLRHIILPIYLKWIRSWVSPLRKKFSFQESIFIFLIWCILACRYPKGQRGQRKLTWIIPTNSIKYLVSFTNKRSAGVTWPALHHWCRAGHVTRQLLMIGQ